MKGHYCNRWGMLALLVQDIEVCVEGIAWSVHVCTCECISFPKLWSIRFQRRHDQGGGQVLDWWGGHKRWTQPNYMYTTEEEVLEEKVSKMYVYLQIQQYMFICLKLYTGTCTCFMQVHLYSDDRENQNPKWVKTVAKTAAKSAGQGHKNVHDQISPRNKARQMK